MGIFLNLLLSKFKAIAILSVSSAGASAITVPVAIAGNKYEEHLFREFNPAPKKYEFTTSELASSSASPGANNETTDTSQFTNFPSVKVSNSQLIKGTTAYNNGNYVLYFGSEACPNCNNFLYGENESPKIWRGSHDNVYRNGIFYETYSLAKSKQSGKIKDVKFIFFSDEIPSMDNRNNDDLVRIPWTKWPETLISQGHIKDDFVRHDKSAVQFRKIQSLLLYYFGTKVLGIPTVIVYRDGVPFIYGSDKIEELEKDKKLAGNFLTHQEATADNAEQNAILRFDLFRYLSYIYDKEIEWIK